VLLPTPAVAASHDQQPAVLAAQHRLGPTVTVHLAGDDPARALPGGILQANSPVAGLRPTGVPHHPDDLGRNAGVSSSGATPIKPPGNTRA
jgi:hypothetical protein